MIIFRLVAICVLILSFSTITPAADQIRNPTIDASSQEFETYKKTVTESVAFLYSLSRCLNAIKLPEHGKSSTYALPPSAGFNLKYPLTLKTEYATEAENANLTVFILSKETATAPWKLLDAWTQKGSDGKKTKITIPSAALQKKANDALPGLAEGPDNCK